MKIIKIKNCGECPYCKLFPGLEGSFRCSKNNRKKVYQLSLPDWCPLKDTTCSGVTSQSNTFCPNGGAGVAVDREGFCLSCGATAVGPAVDQLFNDLADQLPSELPDTKGKIKNEI